MIMAKRQRKPKKSVKAYSFFVKDGDGLKRVRKSCPKCGRGFFLAQHSNRLTCGKCRYVEFVKKDSKKE